MGLAPDLILANGTPAALAVGKQTRSVPVVFVQVTDPVGRGWCRIGASRRQSHRPPSFEFTIGTKWLEMLKVVAPQVTRVALLFNPATAPFANRSAADRSRGAFLRRGDADLRGRSGRRRIERALETFAREPDGGLIVLPDVTTTNHRDLIIALAARYRLPAVYPFRHFAASGGLVSYGTDVADVFRRAASYVDRILKGARPGELPVQALPPLRASVQPERRRNGS